MPPRSRSTMLLLLLSSALIGCTESDSWPGDAAATSKHQEIDAERAANAITLTSVNGGAPLTRAAVCRHLVGRHFTLRAPGPRQSNGEFLACPDLDRGRLQQECENALARPDGFDGPEGWQRWAGEHRGTWYDDNGTTFADRAVWSQPRREATRVSGDVNGNGDPRVYDFQPVVWPGRRAGRRGWNQSHPDVPYVWGWDPKEGENANGDIGTHVGYPIDLPPCHFIVWFTPGEAFLEGVDTADPNDRRKASVGFFGRGQWHIH